MVRDISNPVRIALACAVLLAQAAVPAFGRECERTCCMAVAPENGRANVAPAGDCCSHDGAAIGGVNSCPTDASGDPCRCRLEPREDAPLAAGRDASSPLIPSNQAAAVGPALPVPRSVGVSREYLATTLAVPIRPPRILFGVWRN